MAEETPGPDVTPDPLEPPVDETRADGVAKDRRTHGGKIARYVIIGLGSLLALIAVLLLLLDTSPGRRFVVNQIAGLEFENGMKIRIGRIDGSIYDEMTIHNLDILDPKGVFLSVNTVEMDWSPFAFIGNVLDIDTLLADQARLARLPEFAEVPATDDPLLPAFDIHVGEFAVNQLEIAPIVTGKRHLARLSGKADIRNQTLNLVLDGRAQQGQGLAGGDTFKLLLDAKPDENRLAMDLTLAAPTGGLVTSLVGLEQPLDVTLKGKGDWKNWGGRFNARLGSDVLAGLDLTARNGRFSIKGDSRPALLMDSAMANLFGPVTTIDADIALTDPQADDLEAVIDANIRSQAFSLTANGRADIGNDRFDQLALSFMLLQPATLAENLYGRSVRADLILDGAFATPTIDYKINAAAIGFNDIVIERLTAQGTSRINPDRILIPVQARAARINGLEMAAGGTLLDVRIDGDLAMQGPRILSDNLRIRSDRIDATAIIVVDMSQGLYTGALEGRINNYRVESVGIFNVDTTADLEFAAGGGFVLKGRVRARSTRLFNDSVQEFLGGSTLIAADVSYGTDGVAQITRLNIGAPALRLNGTGRYDTDGGGIRLAAAGNSSLYGPLQLNVSGTLGAPVARLRAERPGLGVGLVDLDALLTGSARGYDVSAKGLTDYGPVSADLLILSGSGPLVIDIAQANFAGVDLAGRLTQTAAGPFSGTLRADGSGVNGAVTLAARGDAQAANVNLSARNAVFEGPVQTVRIGRAIIRGDIILYDQPDITAQIQLGEVQYGDLYLNAARADIAYRGGRGEAKAVAEGNTASPSASPPMPVSPRSYGKSQSGDAPTA